MWREVFTDPALAARSYEPYEFIGDKKLNELNAARAIKIYPLATEEQLTNLTSYYGSNKGALAKIMKDYFIDINVERDRRIVKEKQNVVEHFMFLPDPSVGTKLTDSIYADMFEAILGGFYLVGESIQIGLGDVYARRWYEHIYVSVYPTFEEVHMRGNAKQIVENLFSRFKFYIDSPNDRFVVYSKIDLEEKKDGVRSVKGWIEVTPALTKFITNLKPAIAGKKAKNFSKYDKKVTEVTSGHTKDNKLEVSRKFMDWLKETCDIDVEWAERVKSQLDAQIVAMNPELRDQIDTIEKFLAKKNLASNFYFNRLSKHSEDGKQVAIQILSLDKEKVPRVLFTRVIPTGNTYDARTSIIQQFAEEIKKKNLVG